MCCLREGVTRIGVWVEGEGETLVYWCQGLQFHINVCVCVCVCVCVVCVCLCDCVSLSVPGFMSDTFVKTSRTRKREITQYVQHR